MSLQVVGAYQARQNFGELLEKAFYQGENFLVKRGKKRMAYLIGQPTMIDIFELMGKDQALADTLAILTNPSVKKIIENGGQDIKANKTHSLKSLLEE